jgi:hypothetical protein
MTRPPLAVLSFLFFGCLLVASEAQEKRAKATRYRGCETLCADLHLSIQRSPERLGMWLEDALVIQESCAEEIVAAAMDAVGNQPELVRAILETAIRTAPRREREIRTAVKRFSIPAATPMLEPQEEIRRAVVSGDSLVKQPAIEVRRALAPDQNQTVPIEEVRRAVIVPSRHATQNKRAKAKKVG